MSFEYGAGGNFVDRGRSDGGKKAARTSGYNNKEDQFEATQRVRLQLDAVASESLSGTVFFEIGNTRWGNNSSGGALGADGKIVELRRAYIDWIMPNTDLKVRMGIQGLSLPTFTTGTSQVFDADVAAVVLSNKFNDNVTLTGFWARPYNDNWSTNAEPGTANYSPSNYMDNMDLFGLLLPMSFDGVKVTPWVMVGAIGPNTFRSGGDYLSGVNGAPYGLLPTAYALKNYKSGTNPDTLSKNPFTDYSTAFWAGLTGEVTMWDPFRIAWDLNYGGTSTSVEALNRGGFYGSLLAEYKLDWGTPGLYFWYSTGDDSNIKNGSERMATFDFQKNGDNTFSNYAFSGNTGIARENTIGQSMIGTWGIGGRIKDFSFMEGLKQTFRINYMGGTNSPSMAKYIKGAKFAGGNGTQWWQNTSRSLYDDFNEANGLYLTTMDSALEFGLTTEYKIYDNLTFMFDAAYIALWLDQSKSVWGGYYQGGNSASWTGANSITDAWNLNASFIYSF